MTIDFHLLYYGKMGMSADDDLCFSIGDEPMRVSAHHLYLRAGRRVCGFDLGPAALAYVLRQRHGIIGMDMSEEMLGKPVTRNVPEQTIAVVLGIEAVPVQEQRFPSAEG